MKSYGITLHNYCLMLNHYHLLIEIRQENLSKFMRQLNMNYAIYFNKKYKRTGHLWQGLSECLQSAWIVKQYHEKKEAIKAFLTTDVDSTELQEMRKASSLVEAPHVEKQLDSTRLKKYFENVQMTKERNAIICKAYQEGYSQHKIAKVLGLAQSTVSAIVKKGMR